MKRRLTLGLLLIIAITAYTQNTTYRLDLSDDNITYNENEVWDGIYSNENFKADGFVFSHVAPYGVGYYEGFLPSRNTDNANHYDAPGWTANQWGCMAQGGVNLNSGENFYAEAIAGKPFMINYFSAYSLTTAEYGTSYITTADNSTFTPQGIYICNSPWGYYGSTQGDGFARPLTTENDYYKITFNGVKIDNGTTTSVDYYLAEYLHNDRNGDGIINEQDNYTNNHWSWCDLKELGAVDVIYITMDSSDKGDYGMNTSTIVCLDGLSATVAGSVDDIENKNEYIYASNGLIYLQLVNPQPISIYNTTGTLISTHHAASGIQIVDASHLPHGIYLVRCNGKTTKIML